MRSRAELERVNLAPKGTDFIRGMIALAANDSPLEAEQYAEQRWGHFARAIDVAKASVPAMGSDVGAVSAEGSASEFWAATTQSTILGKLAGLRRVPLRVRTLTATAGDAYWTSEGGMKPLSPVAYTASLLEPLKVASVVVVTDELLRDTSPAAEALIRADLARACSEMLDAAFIDPTSAGTLGVTPASVTNGVTPVTATADLDEDLRDLVEAFTGDLDVAYFVTSPHLAVALSGADRPLVGARGGTLLGVPVVTSRSVPDGAIILLDPSGIAVAEGAASGKVIRQGDVLMADTGSMASSEAGSPSGAIPASLVSLWQNDCAAIVAERVANWSVVRDGSVALITGATYAAGSP